MNDSGSLKQITVPRTKGPLTEYLFVKMQNLRHTHERILARFLERRGWVVFYLDKQARTCDGQRTCWLGLYEQSRRK